MGMHVYVYKQADPWFGDSSLNGVTNRFNKLCVINMDGPFEPDEETPAVRLVNGNLPGTVKIVPDNVGDRWPMFGGNYAATSDSRFGEAISKMTGKKFEHGIVPVHDRFESAELHAYLSV